MRFISIVLAALVPVSGFAQQSRTALAPGVWAITNVNVIPMARDTVLRDRTVLVRDGRIAAIEPARRARVPAGAARIDGRGKYLIPGLADMHTHLFSDDQVPDSAGPAELGVMVANGLTAVRLMIGTPEHLGLRRAIAAGTVVGPQLYIASPQFIGRQDQNARVVRTPDEARQAVREMAEAGYDYVKLTLDIAPEVYDAIVAEARQRRIPVVGHVDPRIGVTRALAAGQHIEHLDNYMESVLADSAPSRESVSDLGLFQPARWRTLDWVDDRKIDLYAGATARSGTYTTPTLNMFRRAFGLGETDQEIRGRADWDMMPANWRRGYLNARQNFWGNPPTPERRRRYIEVRARLVKAIADSGGTIMAGSDSPEWLHVYGFALHRELESLVAAGLRPYQALAAATVNPARFTGSDREWGTIETGKRADLVLLDADPLADIRHTTRISGVSLGGRWLPRAELDAMLERGTRALDGRAPDSLRAGGPRAVRSLAAFGLARPDSLAPGVYAITRAEPLALAGNGNSLVVIGDRDVTVVDAQFTRQATLETIAVIRSLTALPVGTVINTHWHDDHMAGNQVYRDTFPEARFVMHASTAADLASIGAPNRTGTFENAPQLVDRYARLLGMGLGIDSTALTPPERTSLQHALRIMRRYLAEGPGFREVPASELVRERLTLRSGSRTIDLRWFGCGNTRGDLVVHLPDDGIVATGDLLVMPVPFAFLSFPRRWVGVLDSVAALRPRIIVPGHGMAQRDDSYLRSVRDLLGAVVDQASAAAARGDSLPQALASITLDAERLRWTNDEKWGNWMFNNFFRQPAVTRAFNHARAGRDTCS